MSASAQPPTSEQLTRAHVVPLAVFMAFMVVLQLIGGFIEWKHPDAPWWRQDPAQFVYPVQTIVVLGLLIRYWKFYQFDRSLKWSLAGLVFGAIGIGFWLLPTVLYDAWGLTGKTEGWMAWLGISGRNEGFDPSLFQHPVAYWGALLCRFFRAVIVVSLAEEIFWRGFLMRFLCDRDGDYWKVPFGRANLLSYAIVTGLFIVAHGSEDRAPAFIYGSLTYLLCVWSKNLGACVVMHATANFLMGLYIMKTGHYGLW